MAQNQLYHPNVGYVRTEVGVKDNVNKWSDFSSLRGVVWVYICRCVWELASVCALDEWSRKRRSTAHQALIVTLSDSVWRFTVWWTRTSALVIPVEETVWLYRGQRVMEVNSRSKNPRKSSSFPKLQRHCRLSGPSACVSHLRVVFSRGLSQMGSIGSSLPLLWHCSHKSTVPVSFSWFLAFLFDNIICFLIHIQYT